MTSENIILFLFAGLPLALGLALVFFFRRFRVQAGISHRWLRLLAGNLLVLLLLLSLLVLGGECYFRFWYDQPDSFGLMKTSKQWFARHYKSNAAGARDNVDYFHEIPPGKRRVTFLGDSFTVGHGIRNVDDRFANLIRKAHPSWDVQCVGANGWDTPQELAELVEMLGMPRPAGAPVQLSTDPSGRIVLAGDTSGALFLGRDGKGRAVIREPARPGETLGQLTTMDIPAGRFPNMVQLDTVVLVYNLNDVSDLMPEWPAAMRRIYEDSRPGWLGEHSYLLNTLHYRLFARSAPELKSYYGFTRSAYQPDSNMWRQQAERLKLLEQLVRTGGGRLLVVTFPLLDRLGEAYPYREAHALLDKQWRRLDVPHLDLLPVFVGRDPKDVTVNPYDAHPNENAHQMAATAIARFIEENMGK